MALISFASASRSRTNVGDWSQAELAEIYRVLHLLQKAGVSICLDRGVTDKDEPWCVYFDPTGEDIFLHIARLDGEYILVSEILDVRVTGRDFRTATSRFEEAIGIVLKNNEERSRKVVAHPAAQLMFSLAAIFLVVKAKAAIAGEHSAAGMDDVDTLEMAKIRALLNRIQESVDNPVLVAAIVGAIALTASATSLNELKLTDVEIAKLRHSDGQHDTLDAAIAAAHVGEVAETEDTGHGRQVASADVQAQTTTDVQKQGIQVQAKAEALSAPDGAAAKTVDVAAVVQDHSTSGIHAGAVADAPAKVSDDADSWVVAEVQEAATQVRNAGSTTQPVSTILEALNSSSGSGKGYLVVDLNSGEGLNFDGLITLAQASTASEIASIIQADEVLGFNGGRTSATSLTLASSTSSVLPDTALASGTMAAETLIGGGFVDHLAELIRLFGEVDVYAYSTNQVIIVDTDVRYLNGSELAFVSGEIQDGFTVSLVGTRAAIDTFLQA